MMTSRDHERSWSWPRYVWCPLSRKWLEIATWWQWSPVIGNCNVIVTPIVTPIGNGHLYYRAHSWRLYICSCRCSCMSRTLRSTKSEDMYRDHTYKYDCLNNGPEPLQKILTQHDSLKNEWTYVCSHKTMKERLHYNETSVHISNPTRRHTADGCSDKWRSRITKDCIQYLRISMHMNVYIKLSCNRFFMNMHLLVIMH